MAGGDTMGGDGSISGLLKRAIGPGQTFIMDAPYSFGMGGCTSD